LEDFMQTVTGRILRIQPNGFGVVRLDNGTEAFFDRFGVLASTVRRVGRLREGAHIRAEPEKETNGVIKLTRVSPA